MSAPASTSSLTTRRPKREATEEQKRAAEARRAELVGRSGPIQLAQKMSLLPWAFFPTVNAAIQFQYALETGRVIWHTFHDWKDYGYKVKTGEKGFAIWSAPQKGTEGVNSETGAEPSAEVPTGESHGSSRSYFRLCYLFHEGQVEPIPNQAQAELEPTIDLEGTIRALQALENSMTPIPKDSDENSA